MASACAINAATSSPDALLWPSPRLSFSRDLPDQPDSDLLLRPDPSTSPKPASDFEFHLHGAAASIIPADELFSNGKLVPLQPGSSPPPPTDQESPLSDPDQDQDQDQDQTNTADSSSDMLAPSPRPPMCASRWKDLLRLKRAKGVPIPSKKTGANQNPNPRALRFLLKKNATPKAASDQQSMSSPLLPSGSNHEEIKSKSSDSHPPKIRLVRPVPVEDQPNPDSDPIRPARVGTHAAPAQPPAQPPRTGPSVDSPRLNAAGRVVFERSSSSPGSFNGGPRVKYRGIERSYSANVNGVRIAPVLNVPVCSLRGSRKSVSVFGFERIFKGDRRERSGSSIPPAGARAGASGCSTTTTAAACAASSTKVKSEGE